MIIRNVFVALFSTALVSCTTAHDPQWGPIADPDKANISLTLKEKSLTKTSAYSERSREGWGETGEWESNTMDNNIQSWVYVRNLTKKIFTSRSPRKLEESIRQVSGDGYIEFDEIDQFNTKFGPVNFQYYTVSGLSCFFVESYWGDKSVGINTRIRYGKFGEVIIGNYLMQAYYCEKRKEPLQFEEVKEFLEGLHVRGVYWPNQRFTEVDDLL